MHPIPARLNIVLTVLATAGCAALLWGASHTTSGWVVVACAVAFSFLNNTVFSLLHEAVHSVLHPNRAVNEWMGRWVAAFFPTGLSFQRVVHLGHHRRNRTEAELFDYIRPGDNKAVKWLQWYGLLTGLFWVLSPIACALYLFVPKVLESAFFRGDNAIAQQAGADAMLSGFDRADRRRIQAELVLAIAIQAGLWWTLDLTLVGWAACYGAFALNWCSLQYADHAWSPLHVRDGAWNLRVNPVVRALFLNYHDHLVHHQHPRMPWIHLPRHVDTTLERPTFLSIYLRMWLGPRPLPADTPLPRTTADD